MTKFKQPSREKPKPIPPCTRFPRHEWEYVKTVQGVGIYECACGARKNGIGLGD